MSQFLSLLLTKIVMSLKAEAARTRISYAWWLLEPCLQTLVFYLVFGVLLGQGSLEFLRFILVGLIVWTWFARSVQNSMLTLKGSEWLLANTRINPFFLTLVEVGQDFVKQGITFSFLCLALVALGADFTLLWLLLPFFMLLQLLFVTVLACLAAVLVAMMEDLKYLVSTGLMLVMFVSGIFYEPTSVLLPSHQTWFFLNPVAALLESYRQILLVGSLPQGTHLGVVIAWTLIAAFLLWVFYLRNRGRFAELISEG